MGGTMPRKAGGGALVPSRLNALSECVSAPVPLCGPSSGENWVGCSRLRSLWGRKQGDVLHSAGPEVRDSDLRSRGPRSVSLRTVPGAPPLFSPPTAVRRLQTERE